MLNYLQQMRLKLLQKELFKKQQKQAVIGSVIKLVIKSQKFQKINSKILQRQLQFHEYDKEIPKERCVTPAERQEIIDELRLK